ncbi:hypothetical protein JVU11DRAFT_2177 [Chiua virens]|nr:hypothetical protein JVU11DRAFT_2177 [Chiua virens]
MGICISTQGGAKKVCRMLLTGNTGGLKEASQGVQTFTPRLVQPAAPPCHSVHPLLNPCPRFRRVREVNDCEATENTSPERVHRRRVMSYRPAIYQNTLESAQAVLLAMRKIGLSCVDLNNRVRVYSLVHLKLVQAFS